MFPRSTLDNVNIKRWPHQGFLPIVSYELITRGAFELVPSEFIRNNRSS